MRRTGKTEAALPSRLIATRLEAGCDEAGRGCLAGPVVAAAVILPPDLIIPGLDDSKKLTEARRLALREIIIEKALDHAVAIVSPQEIDRINILQASFVAMTRAVESLKITPEHLLIDGNRFRSTTTIPHTCIVKGDGKIASIAAASVLAKTTRDEYMKDLAKDFPHYGWEQNAGYPTQKHLEALHTHGITPHHRRSFGPCQPTLFDLMGEG
ncbi:ribonuclease HII [Porphyromonas sp.]|uniref:ribonuclease HII n=1 Tax=Porphyromonas sp. TaxID=1924944 RepID=UPI0026DABB8F|nr:ribonuclease HII [Porphyromonas sp.]MDO4770401.1 ribonuclease HII [Porphyromonas sp.]